MGRDLAWNFYKENKEEIKNRFSGLRLACTIIEGIVPCFATEEMAKEIEQFFKDFSMPGTDQVVAQSLEEVRIFPKNNYQLT